MSAVSSNALNPTITPSASLITSPYFGFLLAINPFALSIIARPSGERDKLAM